MTMENEKKQSVLANAKENGKEALGCIFIIIIVSCIFYFLQEIGTFDNLSKSNKSTPMTQPGDPYLHSGDF